MKVTGTHFNYYQVCKRKLWLFANGITMEHTSDLVYEGKLIHEESYPRRSAKYEEVEIDGIKVDYYDTGNKIIHEIKKSDKIERAHEWQLKYYIYIFDTLILTSHLWGRADRMDLTADRKDDGDDGIFYGDDSSDNNTSGKAGESGKWKTSIL